MGNSGPAGHGILKCEVCNNKRGRITHQNSEKLPRLPGDHKMRIVHLKPCKKEWMDMQRQADKIAAKPAPTLSSLSDQLGKLAPSPAPVPEERNEAVATKTTFTKADKYPAIVRQYREENVANFIADVRMGRKDWNELYACAVKWAADACRLFPKETEGRSRKSLTQSFYAQATAKGNKPHSPKHQPPVRVVYKSPDAPVSSAPAPKPAGNGAGIFSTLAGIQPSNECMVALQSLEPMLRTLIMHDNVNAIWSLATQCMDELRTLPPTKALNGHHVESKGAGHE